MSKILVISPSLKGGGLERNAAILSEKWVNTYSMEVGLATLDSENPFYALDDKVRLFQPRKFISLVNRWIRSVFLLFWLIKIYILYRPDCIISLGETYNSFILCTLKVFGKPIYVSNRASPLSSLKGFRGLVNPAIYPLAEAVIVQTNKAKTILREKYKNSKFVVIPNPVKTNNFNNEKRENIILNVGYIGGSKNQELLIKYFNSLTFSQNWRLYFVGKGPNMDHCIGLRDRLELTDSIMFKGQQKNVYKYYNQSKIFAFVSTSEGFPNVLAEAMSAGCACISFDCVAGPSDLIEDGVNGFLIPEGDHDRYLNRLQVLVNNEKLRKQFGENSQKKIKEYSADKIAKRYLDVMKCR